MNGSDEVDKMTDDEQQDWVQRARAKAQQRMEEARRRFELGTHAHYEVDLAAATIRFRDTGGREQLCASLQVAGSWSPGSASWMWGWANDSVPQAARSRLQAVRARGDEQGVEPLQAAIVECDEGDAWSLASLAADVLDAQCLYRTDGPKNQLFLLLFDIQRTD